MSGCVEFAQFVVFFAQKAGIINGGEKQQRGHLFQLDCNEAGALVIIGTTTRLPGEGVVINAIKALRQFQAVCVRLLVPRLQSAPPEMLTNHQSSSLL